MYAGHSRPRLQPADDAADLALLLDAVRQRLQASALAAPPGDALTQVVLDCVQALHCLQGLLDPVQRADAPAAEQGRGDSV